MRPDSASIDRLQFLHDRRDVGNIFVGALREGLLKPGNPVFHAGFERLNKGRSMLGPKLAQAIFHFVGRLVRACGCERVSYLANIETGEATFADDAARRDELFMQTSAIPADNYKPCVRDNDRGVQRFVRNYAGCDAVNLLAPFDGPHFGTQ